MTKRSLDIYLEAFLFVGVNVLYWFSFFKSNVVYLFEDVVLDLFLQGIFCNKVYFATKYLFEVELQCEEFSPYRMFEFDEEVNIALVGKGAIGEWTEEAHFLNRILVAEHGLEFLQLEQYVVLGLHETKLQKTRDNAGIE